MHAKLIETLTGKLSSASTTATTAPSLGTILTTEIPFEHKINADLILNNNKQSTAKRIKITNCQQQSATFNQSIPSTNELKSQEKLTTLNSSLPHEASSKPNMFVSNF